MRWPRGRRSLLGTGCATLVVLVTTAVVALTTLLGESRSAETREARYLAQVAAVCQLYGPRLDRIRPPDVAEPANVIDAINRVLPLLRAQERRLRALEVPPELRSRVTRWFRLQDRRLGFLEQAVAAGRKQDFRTMSVAYVDFALAGSDTGRLGSAIGVPHPPC
jgi:hypothetical protein